MIILGIDPGSRITGYGIIDGRSSQLRRIASGCIRTRGDSLGQRMNQIFSGISSIIDQYQPQTIAVEKVFVAVNVKSALMLGHARGAAICACAVKDLEIYEYAAREIKKTVAASGNATKEQVQFMVTAILSLTEQPQQDESDALACAITHHQHLPMLESLEDTLKAHRFRQPPATNNVGAPR